jgi:nucleoside-diphosphate-sugar epimerase
MTKILIAGCGYIGQALGASLRAEGIDFVGLTRSESGAEALRLQGWEAFAADIGDLTTCQRLAQCLPDLQVVVHCAASGRGGTEADYAKVYRDGCQNLLTAFPQAALYFTSSTSVYPQIDGTVITEETEAEPKRGNGQLLRAAENLVREGNGTVLRLGGIYGPGRSVLLRNFLEGKSTIDTREQPPATPDGRWINQIHQADVVGGLRFLMAQPASVKAGQIFNLTDSRPLTQREVYTVLSAKFALPMPPSAVPDETRKRGWSHKQVSNAKLRGVGWSPTYPDYFTALEHDPELVPSILRSLSAQASDAASS